MNKPKTRRTRKTRKTRLFDTSRPTEVVHSYRWAKVVRVYVCESWPKRFCRKERLRLDECTFTRRVKPVSIYWCDRELRWD